MKRLKSIKQEYGIVVMFLYLCCIMATVYYLCCLSLVAIDTIRESVFGIQDQLPSSISNATSMQLDTLFLGIAYTILGIAMKICS